MRVLINYAQNHKNWDTKVYGNLGLFLDRMLMLYMDQEKRISHSRYIETQGMFRGRVYLFHPAKHADEDDKELLEDIFLKTVESLAPETEAERRRKKQVKRKKRKQRKLDEALKENVSGKSEADDLEWDSDLEEEYEDYLEYLDSLDAVEEKNNENASENGPDASEEEIADNASERMPEATEENADDKKVSIIDDSVEIADEIADDTSKGMPETTEDKAEDETDESVADKVADDTSKGMPENKEDIAKDETTESVSITVDSVEKTESATDNPKESEKVSKENTEVPITEETVKDIDDINEAEERTSEDENEAHRVILGASSHRFENGENNEAEEETSEDESEAHKVILGAYSHEF